MNNDDDLVIATEQVIHSRENQGRKEPGNGEKASQEGPQE